MENTTKQTLFHLGILGASVMTATTVGPQVQAEQVETTSSSLTATKELATTESVELVTETTETTEPSSSSTTETSQEKPPPTTTESSTSTKESSTEPAKKPETSETKETTSTSKDKTKETTKETTTSTKGTTATTEKKQPVKQAADKQGTSKDKKNQKKTTKETPKKEQSDKKKDDQKKDEEVFFVSPNYSTQAFIKTIANDAQDLAWKHDLYASVMIAQAILESGSGNSQLSAPPNYNLFGIKGYYEGATVRMKTAEHKKSGETYTITAGFRKYPSYRESLEDYVKLLRGGLDGSGSFYRGTWRSQTSGYQEATKFLTGRYATDINYNKKLNAIIDAYGLTKYDGKPGKKAVKKVVAETNVLDKVTDKKVAEKEAAVETLKEPTLTQALETDTEYQPEYEEPETSEVESEEEFSENESPQAARVMREEEIRQMTLAPVIVDRNLETTHYLEQEHYMIKVEARRRKSSGYYEVQATDTLASIAKKFDISVSSLRAWNHLDQYFLTEGQLLSIVPPYFFMI